MTNLIVTNPTPFDRKRWAIFGSDGDPTVGVQCRKLPRGQIEAKYIEVLGSFQGEDTKPDNYRENVPFLSKPVETALAAGLFPYIIYNDQSLVFQLHSNTWVANIPGSNEPAITKWEWRAQGDGFYARLWTILGRGDVVMPFQLMIVFESKEVVRERRVVDFGIEGSWVESVVWTRKGAEHLLDSTVTDRQSVSFKGSFMFYANATVDELTTLQAEFTGPLIPYSPRETIGVWNKKIPRISQEAWWGRHSDKINALKLIAADPMAYVGFIGTKRPANTGAQGGFGTWQGIFTHAASWGTLYRQSEDAWLDGLIAEQECRRPIFFMESNGEIVRSSEHFDFVSWEQGPHWSKVLSPDQLNRDKQNWYLLNGDWIPNDEEHDVSALWPAHDVRINDSEVSRLTLEMASEHLIARHTMPSTKPKWATNGFGAGRAVGRTLLNVAEIYFATGNVKLLKHMEKKWLEVIEPLYQDPLPDVPVYRVIEKDDRVFNGKKPGWVVWEDAIFVMGADAFEIALRESGTNSITTADKVRRIVDAITASIIKYGFMPDASNPMVLKLVSWELRGAAIPSSWYNDTKKEFIEDSFNTDFTTWARPALDIARRWLTSDDKKLKAIGERADTLLKNLSGSMDLYRVAKYSGVK